MEKALWGVLLGLSAVVLGLRQWTVFRQAGD